MDIEFSKLNQHLISCGAIPRLLPGGKKRSNEWVCSDITGGEGESFSINLLTGIWAEFAGDARGGDIISLYAAQNQKTQHESAEILAKMFSYSTPDSGKPYQSFSKNVTGVWEYHNAKGEVVAAVARKDDNGKKSFVQQSIHNGKWEWKAHPEPRPLYRLNELLKSDRPVLVVEGEKTADYAHKIAGHVYCVTTWSGGAQAVLKTDFTPLFGRKILLLPDADLKRYKKTDRIPKGFSVGDIKPYEDQPGVIAMNQIVGILKNNCSEIKIINVGIDESRADGWDLADSGWDFKQFFDWARERVTVIDQKTPVPSVQEPVHVAEIVDPAGEFATWETLGLPLGAGKRPICNMVSARRVIEADNLLAGNVWFDTFYNKMFLRAPGETSARQIEAHDIISATYRMQEKYGLSTMDKKTVRDAMVLIARADTRNEPLDWLKTLTWDGVDRITGFFHTYYGTPDDVYHRDVARYFWAGMARRLIEPGCQLNCMVVLQGPQGRYKSTSLSIIGGKWYAVSANEIGTKDFIQSLMGKLIIEIGELSSFKKSDIEVIKNTLSSGTDRIRLPYAEDIVDYPRICIMAGTTNEHEFLADMTGARRFYPVTIETCKIDRLACDREQLFAQAYHIAQTDKNWWIVNTEAAEAAQEERRAGDPWEEIINETSVRAAGLDTVLGFKIIDVATKILHFNIDRLTRHDKLRIGQVLRKVGFKNWPVRIGNKLEKRWVPDRTQLEASLIGNDWDE